MFETDTVFEPISKSIIFVVDCIDCQNCWNVPDLWSGRNLRTNIQRYERDSLETIRKAEDLKVGASEGKEEEEEKKEHSDEENNGGTTMAADDVGV